MTKPPAAETAKIGSCWVVISTSRTEQGGISLGRQTHRGTAAGAKGAAVLNRSATLKTTHEHLRES
jgi:hypothetical protein